jgi:hypothetical protein
VNHFIHSSIRRFACIFGLVLAISDAGAASPVNGSDAGVVSPVIVVGFVGGFVKRTDSVHSAVQVGEHLRKDYPAGVHVEVVENHHREEANREIGRLLDVNHDGKLSSEEKKNARIILYGHSWGASEAVTLARELDKEGIPVLLTVQVDSVEKRGENDRVIPANVAEAANFYQADGFLHGETNIRAGDASRTRIVGNFRFSYKTNPIDCKEYPWYDRLFVKAHTEIECDPKVWSQVEGLIRAHMSALLVSE